MVIIYLFFLIKTTKEVVMTSLQVSGSNNQQHCQNKLLKSVGHSEKTPDSQQIVPKNELKSTNSDNLGKIKAPAPVAKHTLIETCLKKLVKKGLYGRPHVKQYLYDLYRRGCRPNTIRSNFGAIFLFLCHLKNQGKCHLETLDREDLGGFVEHEQDRGLKPNTVSTRLRALYAFLGYLVEKETINAAVVKKKMHIKVPDALPKAIDPQDIKRLLAVTRKVRDRALVLVLLRTGMRIGELLGTRLDDVNLRESCIDIYEADKTRIGRVVYFSEDARRALKTWIKKRCSQTPYIFYGRAGKPLCYEAARAAFIKYVDKAGLSHTGYTLHCLRHTCASELLNAGMRLECVQQILGHRSIEMTRRYARLTDNTRREEYFKAMQIIERGDLDGHYRRDRQLPQIFKKTQLFDAHD
jgi:integrase/recombinase XerD